MDKDKAIAFLQENCLYWRHKARDSQEDIEIQAYTQNANNCLEIIRWLLTNA